MSISLTLIAISRCLMSLSFRSFLLLCLSFKFCFYIYLYNITNMFHWLGWDQWIEISWEWNYLLFHLNSCWKNQFSLSVPELVGFCLKWCCIYIFDVIVVIMVDHFSHQLALEERTIWLHVCSVNSCERYFELYHWIFDMHLINLIFLFSLKHGLLCCNLCT